MIRFTELPFRIWNGGFLALHTESTGPICTLYAQCAVIYADGSSECYSKSMNFVLRPREGESFLEMITISSDKAIESFSLEFQLHGNGVMYWEGYLDVPYSN